MIVPLFLASRANYINNKYNATRTIERIAL